MIKTNRNTQITVLEEFQYSGIHLRPRGQNARQAGRKNAECKQILVEMRRSTNAKTYHGEKIWFGSDLGQNQRRQKF